MPPEVAARKVELLGDPADFRRGLDLIDELLPKVKPLLELTPKQQRRFENADASHAPLFLRMLPARTAPIINAPPRLERNRERRAASHRRARAPTGDDPSPSPELEVRSYARWKRDVRRALGGAA